MVPGPISKRSDGRGNCKMATAKWGLAPFSHCEERSDVAISKKEKKG